MIQRGEIGPATISKFDGGFYVQAYRVCAFNGTGNFLTFGLQNLGLLRQMGDHAAELVELGCGGHIDQRHIPGQSGGLGFGQEFLILGVV